MATGILMIVHRYQLYEKYFNDGIPPDMAVVHIMYMTFTSFGTLAYSFANFNSTLLLYRRSALSEDTGSKTWLVAYNTLFMVSICGWLASVIVSWPMASDMSMHASHKPIPF